MKKPTVMASRYEALPKLCGQATMAARKWVRTSIWLSFAVSDVVGHVLLWTQKSCLVVFGAVLGSPRASLGSLLGVEGISFVFVMAR